MLAKPVTTPKRRVHARRPKRASLARIAVIGNYVPRQCGIATFTTDLCESLGAHSPELEFLALPINDVANGYAYPPRVRFEIAQDDLVSYQNAADFLNINNIDLVCLQHEYGIFGGPAGSHILALLRELRMPVVTTLHTILKEPDANQRYVLEELRNLSDRLVVMSERSARFAREIYGVPEDRIDLIPHGIPDVAFVDSSFYKDQFGLQGKTVLLTFGLLSPNKGIEHVIDALPAILERFPNVVYTLVGATHPQVRLKEGESYRLFLELRARQRSVANRMIFHNRFVRLQELMEFVGAADIYITPYLDPRQIVSGALAYSIGAGKAVVSTPYWYAEELLGEGRGSLVPFADPKAIAEQVIALLDDDATRHAMRKRAYLFGRNMVWANVAQLYMRSFERAREERNRHPRTAFIAPTLEERVVELPFLKLDHLENLTDDTGLLQHAVFTHPNYEEGYTVDDNARALVLAVLLEQRGRRLTRAHHYQAFLWHAFDRGHGRFHNCLSYDRQWRDEVGSEDCHGRALWALGLVLGRMQDAGLRGSASRLFDMALPAAKRFSSPRAWAYTLLGVNHYLKQFAGDRAAQAIREELSEKLLSSYHASSGAGWEWFEDTLAYCNARLPQALLISGKAMGRGDLVEIGLSSLRWLIEVQRVEAGHFVPIGSQGFYPRGGHQARFDQQPVEAHTTVSACLEAFRITGVADWKIEAQRAFDWFLGRNDLGLPVYDAATGGCHDGLHPDRVNQNEGAESTLSFLIALAEMKQARDLVQSEPE